jgi:hypothetical protein
MTWSRRIANAYAGFDGWGEVEEPVEPEPEPSEESDALADVEATQVDRGGLISRIRDALGIGTS